MSLAFAQRFLQTAIAYAATIRSYTSAKEVTFSYWSFCLSLKLWVNFR